MIYFASDLHLGLPNFEQSLQREKLFVKWLDEIKTDAEQIYLLGDVFDFWYEWKHVVPQGFTRFLGKIAEITDSGIPVYFFTGNHDIWVFHYLQRETGMIVIDKPYTTILHGKKFYLAHGDGLGPGDLLFKILRGFFRSPISQWLFSRMIHPSFAIRFATSWSQGNRKIHLTAPYLGDDKEWLVLHANEVLKSEHFDYFIFGHRHLPIDLTLSDRSRYINLGDWISHFTYAKFDGENIELLKFENK